jgi:hypothetical protein
MDPTDIMGIPHAIQQKDGSFITTWARPDFIHTQGHGLVLLDEASDADMLTMKASYCITLEKQIKNHCFGKNWYICAAGNRPEDKGMSRIMPAPLITRMCHIGIGCDAPNFSDHTPAEASIDTDKWIEWAFDNHIKSEVIAFIKTRPSRIYIHQATPRTWEFVSRLIVAANSGFENSALADMVRGTVGQGPGTEFMAFARLVSKIPSIDRILVEPEKVEVPEELDIQHAICTELIYRATSKTIKNIVKYIEKLNIEIQTFFITSCVKHDDKLLGNEPITKWLVNHRTIVFGTNSKE